MWPSRFNIGVWTGSGFSHQRHIKDMEKKRTALRMNLFQAQDEVDVRKDKLIEDIEARLKQKLERRELFFIRWKII